MHVKSSISGTRRREYTWRHYNDTINTFANCMAQVCQTFDLPEPSPLLADLPVPATPQFWKSLRRLPFFSFGHRKFRENVVGNE